MLFRGSFLWLFANEENMSGFGMFLLCSQRYWVLGLGVQAYGSPSTSPDLWPDSLGAFCQLLVHCLFLCCFFFIVLMNSRNWLGLGLSTWGSWGILVRDSRVSGQTSAREQSCAQALSASCGFVSYCLTVTLPPCWGAPALVFLCTQGQMATSSFLASES
jgi:hypothetical protein